MFALTLLLSRDANLIGFTFESFKFMERIIIF